MTANAHRALTNALLKIATPAEIPESRERPWASVTFTGARHWVALSVGPARADAVASMLPDHEFDLPGHLVADIAVTGTRVDGDRTVIEIEALTVETH
jgi:hypothetical protein